MANKEILERMNLSLNREVGTALRYLLQAAKIKGARHDAVRQMYEREIADEIGHAQYLANTMVMLGGKPTLDPDLTPPPDDVETMLKNDIAEEKVDAAGYAELAELAGKEGCMDLKMQMENQAADEARHGRDMERMLG